MPFAAGTRLGPYEIIGPLGAGGMGEIYRGRDTRLDRPVAVKVLTGALAADPEARQRFEEEARAIAALNDPHICTIHDVGRHGDLDYLVLEYLEGQTLAERLRDGRALSLDAALAIAIQIGDALDRAHRAGIVHRDLKPGNVMLVAGQSATPVVKLLDFGLAARVGPAGPRAIAVSSAATLAHVEAPTQLAATPAAGFSGTVQYMAPEQISGHDVDHRADIFAFGCVLYEMLAGHKAFDGGNALTVIAAITSTEPASIAQLAATHPLLEHVLRKCLEKNREQRRQSMRDVTDELRWIVERPVVPDAIAPGRRTVVSRAALPVALVLLAIAIAAAALSMRGRSSETPIPSLNLEITTAPTDDPSVALSPDGSKIAFVANRDGTAMLWLRSLDSVEMRPLAGTDRATLPFWSPDGRTLAFFADNKLKRIEIPGGAVVDITNAPNARGGAWSPGGVILYSLGVSAPIMRVSTRGGPVERATEIDGTTGPDHRWPQFLPDGKRFLFSSTLGTAETRGVYLGSLDKTPPVRVVASDGAARFAPPDRLLTVRQGALQAYRFDPAAGTVQGDPVVIAQGFVGAAASAGFTTSDTGILGYRADTAQRRQLVWVNREGTVVEPVGEPRTDFIAAPELSADERSVAVFLQPAGDNDIWVIDVARNLPRRMTDGPPADAHPLWDPDGRHVVFYSRRFADGGPARVALTGGPPEPLLAKGEGGMPLSWTRDRAFLLTRRTGITSGSDLIAIPTSGSQSPIVVAQSSAEETEGQFSPDGRWVALVSNENGRPEVFVQAFPAGQPRAQVSVAGGSQVRWSPKGDTIFFIGPDGSMMSSTITFANAGPDVQTAVSLFKTHLASGTNVLGHKPQYAVARDGRFLLNAVVERASPPIVVFVNWMARFEAPQ